MADLQYQDARQILSLIASSPESGEQLTYTSVALKLGKPRTHARAMASACNLLDAAACLTGVPLPALTNVLSKSGSVNPDAFARDFNLEQRKAIARRSQAHTFGTADFEAIAKSLSQLYPKDGRTAWEYLEGLYPPKLMYLRLMGDYIDHSQNAIDDFGSETPEQSLAQVWTYSRDPKVREAVMKRAKGKCEFCGREGFAKADGLLYLESHHVIALAADGEDRLTNVIALCPNDHREAHFGKRSSEMEAEMISMLQRMTV